MKPDELPRHAIPALDGNNAPVQSEDVFDDMPVLGEVPKDLNGIYLRNGPNPFFAPDWRYHAYDGDGMLHAIRFQAGKVSCRNRWIQTQALQEERVAGRALWKGLKEPMRADRADQPFKNTSNTDVKYHAGRLITMWYRSGIRTRSTRTPWKRWARPTTVGRLQRSRPIRGPTSTPASCCSSTTA